MSGAGYADVAGRPIIEFEHNASTREALSVRETSSFLLYLARLPRYVGIVFVSVWCVLHLVRKTAKRTNHRREPFIDQTDYRASIALVIHEFELAVAVRGCDNFCEAGGSSFAKRIRTLRSETRTRDGPVYYAPALRPAE